MDKPKEIEWSKIKKLCDDFIDEKGYRSGLLEISSLDRPDWTDEVLSSGENLRIIQYRHFISNEVANKLKSISIPDEKGGQYYPMRIRAVDDLKSGEYRIIE